jgi:hypothetical protein
MRDLSDIVCINIEPGPGFTGCLPSFTNSNEFKRQILPVGSGKHYIGVLLYKPFPDPEPNSPKWQCHLWGMCPVTKLVLALDTVEEVSPASAPDMVLRVTYRRSDFIHPRDIILKDPRESLACIQYPVMAKNHPSFISAYLPPEPICFDVVPKLLKARIDQYQQPTEACICSTDDELRQDRLSYMLMLSSMAMLDQKEQPLYPGMKPGWRYTCDAWLRGEMKIARFRTAWHNAAKTFPGARDKERPDLRGRPWHTVPPSFVSGLGRSPNGYLSKGLLFAPSALWAPVVLLETEKNHILNLNTYHPSHQRDHATLAKLLRTHGSLQIQSRLGARFYDDNESKNTGKRKATEEASPDRSDWRRPAYNRPVRQLTSSSTGIAELSDLKALSDAGQLVACSPQCMKALAIEAFTDCGPGKHLRHADRTIFYPYMFANGLEIEHVQPMLVERAKLSKPDYDVRKLDAALKSSYRFVREAKAHPLGCTKLQTTHNKHGRPYCPFMATDVPTSSAASSSSSSARSPMDAARSEARRLCTGDMRETFIAQGIQNAQDLSWKHSNFPLVFAQRVRRVIVVEYEKESATASAAPAAAAASNVPAPMDIE